MKVQLQKILELIFYYALVILGGLFAYLSMKVFVADSEFWSISLGYHFFEDIQHDWVFTRPLFYFLLWLSQIDYTVPSASLHAARGLFVTNAFVMLFFIFKICKQRTQAFFYGAVAAVLLLGNTGFMNQGFRVRSDFLATTLSLAAIYFLQSPQIFQKKKSWFLILVPLLATPKALLQAVGTMGFLDIRLLRKHKNFIGLCVFGVAGLWLATNWNNLEYLSYAFRGHAGTPAYFSEDSFFHLINQLRRNPFFWFLIAARFVTRAYAKENATADDAKFYQDAGYQVLTIFSLLCLFLYTEKVQFFIASLLPFLAIHIAMIFYDLEVLKLRHARSALLFVVFVISLITGGQWFRVNESENQNRFQLMTLDATYRYVLEKKVSSFYDFTCFIPPLCKDRYFVGPNQPSSNHAALVAIAQKPPEIIYYIAKAKLLEPDLSALLRLYYVDVGKGAFVLRPDYKSPNETSQIKTPDEKGTPSNLDSTNRFMDIGTIISGRLSHLFGYDIEY